MTLGEKLVQLRKDKGLSQEALAEQLNTTRQAVSKWENDQGYPETEKLVKLGTIFNVSLDYLLTNDFNSQPEQSDRLYVDEKLAKDYLSFSYKQSRFNAFGVFFLALAFLPYVLLRGEPVKYTLIIMVIVVVMVGFFIAGSMIEENRFKILRQERLTIDHTLLKELTARYNQFRKKSGVFIIIGASAFIAGLIPFLLERKVIKTMALTAYHPYSVILIAIGLYIIVRMTSIIESYKLLIENETHTNKLLFKIKRKVKKRVDDF